MFKRITAAALTLLIGLVFVMPSMASAATATGQGLEISPPLVDIKANPGQVVQQKINVRNVTNGTLVVKAQFEDFVANGEDGRPKILLAKGDKSPYSIKDWLTAPETITLASGQRQTVTVGINVPANASPGGHYGLVRFTGTPPELDTTGVSLSASVGTLMLVTVSGDVKTSASITELYASHNNDRGSLFEYGPVLVTTRVKNTGNVHFKPSGTIQITNMFGKDVLVSQFNKTNSNVLPGSIRKFENLLNQKNLFGRYTVKVDVVYGPDNSITTASTTFWVIPYKMIAIVILAIVLLVFGIKRYNRYIAGRASKKQNRGKNK